MHWVHGLKKSLWRKIGHCLYEFKMQISFDLAIPFLKACMVKYVCAMTLISVLFMKAKD